jgi:hypothetical protein
MDNGGKQKSLRLKLSNILVQVDAHGGIHIEVVSQLGLFVSTVNMNVKSVKKLKEIVSKVDLSVSTGNH